MVVMSDAGLTPRRLVLVRHAKAEPGGEDADHDRQLTDRGRRDATDAGRWLVGVVPRLDEVWCSSAVRAVQTWQAMAPPLTAPEPVVQRALYLADTRDLVGRLERVPAGRTVLLVGHNPVAEQLLAAVVGELRGLRPGAVAVADLDSGVLVDLWSPQR